VNAIIGWAENLLIQYQSNEVPNVAEGKTRQDYYQIDWPIVIRQRRVGLYAEEVLAVCAPFAMGIITNIANVRVFSGRVAKTGGPVPGTMRRSTRLCWRFQPRTTPLASPTSGSRRNAPTRRRSKSEPIIL
jgi:hypothetical protein